MYSSPSLSLLSSFSHLSRSYTYTCTRCFFLFTQSVSLALMMIFLFLLLFNLYHLHLTTITAYIDFVVVTCVYTSMHSQELGLPDNLKEEQKPKEQSADAPACDICKKSHDSHLMASCDTCNKHYHIGCLDPPLSKVPKKSAKWGW